MPSKITPAASLLAGCAVLVGAFFDCLWLAFVTGNHMHFILARACTVTIRVKLFKVGEVVVGNTRRVRVLLASQHPLKHILHSAARAMIP